MDRHKAAEQARTLAQQARALAAAVGRIPQSAPLPSQASEAAALLDRLADSLSDPDWDA
ncbi:MAG TPA: hypothetical protein VFF32_15580 [Dermatophilaceae bacterium]|nr:hypothetical protein [Dermatophilaceae bacterium]